tara:strand:+ start:357 stop:584 length:228 start_codon:yes stop_codon:yes gene_type:complete
MATMRIIIGLNNAKYCQRVVAEFRQSLRSDPVGVTFARFLIHPIDSNDPVNRANDYQERQTGHSLTVDWRRSYTQ